jgi:type I restriction enzyme S subunit
MEVTKGYKKTDAGVIPKDWDITQLGDIIDESRSIRYGIVQPGKYEHGGCLMLRSQDYSKGWQGPDGMHKVNSLIETQYKNARLSKGDQIMTVVGAGIGQVVTAPTWLDGAIASRSTARIAIDSTKASSEFIKAFLISPLGKRQILDCQKEGAQPVLSCRDLANFKIPLPSLQEQTAIGNALTDTDALINGLERLIAKKRDIKQGVMQELLKPKKGWEVKQLGEIGEAIIGLTYTPDNVTDVGTLVLRSSNIQANSLSYNDNVFVNVQVPDKLINKENDILICVRNGSRNLIGKCALIQGRAIGQTFGAFMAMYRSEYNKFIYHVFQSQLIKKQIDEHLGATINQITNKSLNAFEIPFPPLEHQGKIDKTLSDMGAEIGSLESKLEKYRQVKSGMMQNLLTGKIRLV